MNFARLSIWIDWLFTRAALAAGAALIAIILGFVYSGFFDEAFFDRPMGFSSFGQGAFTVYLTAVIFTLALLPFFSLPYLVSGLFSKNAFGQKGLILSTVAMVSSALALMFSIDAGICTRVAGPGGNCVPYQLAYTFDQFSKGGFADVFDIYDFELSVISTSELSWLGKLFTLNFRMISAIYLAMLVVAIFRRFEKKGTI